MGKQPHTEGKLKEKIERYVQRAVKINNTASKLSQRSSYRGIEDWKPEDRAWRTSALGEIRSDGVKLGLTEQTIQDLINSCWQTENTLKKE